MIHHHAFFTQSHHIKMCDRLTMTYERRASRGVSWPPYLPLRYLRLYITRPTGRHARYCTVQQGTFLAAGLIRSFRDGVLPSNVRRERASTHLLSIVLIRDLARRTPRYRSQSAHAGHHSAASSRQVTRLPHLDNPPSHSASFQRATQDRVLHHSSYRTFYLPGANTQSSAHP